MRINGQKVGSLAALRDVIAAEKPGTSVTLTVYRSAQSQSGWKLLTMHVKLGRLPFSPSG